MVHFAQGFLRDNWLTAAELFDSNAELLTQILERSAALCRRRD
jgi:hypothetical protein